ncbi:hypothetical protein [Paenibacillus mucilaginosus]|uniref:hypothetical protein n=1 Tax=Paenibacillus mucilaginosus TaxID=61624 RepID=UPI0005A2E150|nr:hypothetical protein [Paenibacillus mucilaginosus]MCG7218211.1 hypothetical protein [Paenibacillus mucilaginosus]WDM28827.1 hypothetical protein KCX80_06360 [Paenibacillus mucilaginosus]
MLRVIRVMLITAVLLTAPTLAFAIAPPSQVPGKWQDIQWIAIWSDPGNREEKLEQILTADLQGRILDALLEKKYLIASQDIYYVIDPFQVRDIRKDEHGINELDILVTVKDKDRTEARKFLVTFRHIFKKGLVVTDCKKL